MNPAVPGTTPAGFWRRTCAYAIDWLLLGVPLLILLWPTLADGWAALLEASAVLQAWLLDAVLDGGQSLPGVASAALTDAGLRATITGLLEHTMLSLTHASFLALGLAAIYFSVFEASAWQATPGKHLLGLRVSNLRGERLGWPQALARFFAGSLSWLSLNIGHVLAGWRQDGRALHDLVAQTKVSR